DALASERVVAAELARTQAKFEVDELRARIRELEDAAATPVASAPVAPVEPIPSVPEIAVADHDLVARLRGQVVGLRFRLANAERAFAAKAIGAKRGDIALDAVDRLRAELAAQKLENGGLTIEVADLRETTRELRARAGDTTSALAARDALVTRLQLELSELEQRVKTADIRAARLAEESASLRAGVVEAASAGESREHAEREAESLRVQLSELRDRARRLEADRLELEERVERAERERDESEQRAKRLDGERTALADEVLGLATELGELDQSRRAQAAALADAATPDQRAERMEAELELLRSHAEAIAKERDDARALLEETRETLHSLRTSSDSAALPPAEIDREIRDRDVLLGSLTAQLEERNDRIRALERRLSGSVPPGAADEE
ncbi:MAG: hypothetical protein H5U40_07460, partial [Polyangiaceae bacterium]|nr:hypothetical protein [Polyangiaceae bacterium]